MTENPLDLTGRRILVTGASGGIGRATATLLSRLGARLVLTGRDEERLRQTMLALEGADHAAEVIDLAECERIPERVRRISAGGPLAGLVHAAGRQATAPVGLLTAQNLDSVLKTNLHSAAMLVRGFCQRGCHASGGSVVFVASVMALVAMPAISVYCASKAALTGLTRSLALELAGERIRVNCVAPAYVETEMLNQLRETLSEEQFAALEQAHPLGFGRPSDVANAIAFLLADSGSWITGSTLVVDGGYSAK